MREQDNESSGSVGRRSFLGASGTMMAGAVLSTGTAAATDQSNYSRVIDVVEAGADNDGEESITPILEDIVGDDTLLKFPRGRYLMDEQLRFTDFENFGMVGDGYAVLQPAPADQYTGEARMFKLGTYYAPGRNLRIENLAIDFTAENTGIRAFQCQVSDDLQLRDLYFAGQHDAGTWGPMLVDIVDSGGYGVVENVEMLYGGKYTENTSQDADPAVDTGPTGFLLSPYHEGRLDLNNLRIGPFPDNGLYVSGANGQVVVDGGYFRNSNVANVRLAGDNSVVKNATFAVDNNRPEDQEQRAIRLDEGSQVRVYNVEMDISEPNGHGLTVMPGVESARIDEVSMTIGNGLCDGIVVAGDAGQTEVLDTTIETNGAGQAVLVKPGDSDVTVRNVSVTGDATGAFGGRCAVRCDRDGTVFRNLTVDQPGDGYRRGIGIHADDCSVLGGEYVARHHALVSNGDGTKVHEVETRSYDEYEGIKLVEGNAHVEVSDSVVYEGIRDQGTEDLETWGNEYPDA